jgi:hypothetical protein
MYGSSLHMECASLCMVCHGLQLALPKQPYNSDGFLKWVQHPAPHVGQCLILCVCFGGVKLALFGRCAVT